MAILNGKLVRIITGSGRPERTDGPSVEHKGKIFTCVSVCVTLDNFECLHQIDPDFFHELKYRSSFVYANDRLIGLKKSFSLFLENGLFSQKKFSE